MHPGQSETLLLGRAMTRQSYDGVIIGAGVMGATVAFQLASAGMGRLLLLDKAPGPGFGSTGKSNAIIRETYSHFETCLMAHEALAIFRQWGDFTGLAEPKGDFRSRGVIFMMHQDDPAIPHVQALHRRVGVVSEWLDGTELRQRYPDLASCSTPIDFSEASHQCAEGLAVLHEPRGGIADPVGTTEDLLNAARALGVETRFNRQVVEINQQSGRVSGVRMEGAKSAGGTEEVATPVVINCAGPWAMGLSKAAGAPLKQRIQPTRIQKVGKSLSDPMQAPLPVVNDLVNGLHIRPEPGNEQIFLGSFREEHGSEPVTDPDHFNEVADAPFRETVLSMLEHRVPSIRTRGHITSTCGLYSINLEDNQPVIDESELAGLYVACGFSGHGFKLSPIVGMMMAQKILGQWGKGRTEVPLEFFSRGRNPHRSFWGGFFA